MTDERKAMFEVWKNKNKDKIEGVVITLLSYEKGVDTKTCYDEVDWLIRKAFIAGFKEGRPKWHNLQKDPTDLPKEKCDVLDENGNTLHYDSGYFYKEYIFCTKEYPVAWCEIPIFDKE